MNQAGWDAGYSCHRSLQSWATRVLTEFICDPCHMKTIHSGLCKLWVPNESSQALGLSRPSAVSSRTFCLNRAFAHCRCTLGFTLWEFLKLLWRSNHPACLKNRNTYKSLSLSGPISSATQGCARGLAAVRILQAYCHRRTASQELQDCSWALLVEQNQRGHCHRHCKQCSAEAVWCLIDWEEFSRFLCTAQNFEVPLKLNPL